MTAVVETEGLSKRFGGIVVAEELNLEFRAGEIVGLIGPNGAGKTSLFNLLSGSVACDSGSIRLNGERIERKPMHSRARRGIARTWQDIRLFPSLTVLDNLMVAPRLYAGESFMAAIFGQARLARERARTKERAMAQLEKVKMLHAAHRFPGEFSYGKQKLVSLARALMNDGNCLLLDEPMAGVEGPAYEAIKNVVRDEAEKGRAVCIVEHNIAFVRDLCDRAIFMFNGRVISTGTVEEMVASPELTELYFGH